MTLSPDTYRGILAAHGSRRSAGTAGRTAFESSVDRWTAQVLRKAASVSAKQRSGSQVSRRVTPAHVEQALGASSSKPRQRGGEGALGHTVLPAAYFGGPDDPAYAADGVWSPRPLDAGLPRPPLTPQPQPQSGGDGAHGHTVLPGAYFDAGTTTGYGASSTADTLVSAGMIRDPIHATFRPQLTGGSGGSHATARPQPRRSREVSALITASIDRFSADTGLQVGQKARACVRHAVHARVAAHLSK